MRDAGAGTEQDRREHCRRNVRGAAFLVERDRVRVPVDARMFYVEETEPVADAA